MPFTPLHFGLGGILHAITPRRISFLSFCAANVLIDIEPLVYLLRDDSPLHRFWHTLAGATLVAMATVVGFVLLRMAARRWTLPNILQWQELSLYAVILGAATGVYSHLLLDGIMHVDVQPLAPLLRGNPWHGLVDIDTLNLICFGLLLVSAIGAWRCRLFNQKQG